MQPELPSTLAEAVALLKAKAISAQWLIEAVLDRIDRFDGRLNSFILVDRAAAIAQARSVDVDRTLLAGAPLAIKDVIDVAGMPTTGNSRLPGRHPSADASSVAALRREGAVILGKLAAWELAIGGTSFSLPWPPARNPWDLGRDPGGSSTGSAAAIAAGLCYGSLGTDTGGSIREPAAWCGIAGLKPTHRVVGTQGVMQASLSLDHIGPMARTSQDCAILLDALTGNGRYARAVHDDAIGLRVGIVDLGGEPNLYLDPDVQAALDQATRRLSGSMSVVRVQLPRLAVFSAVCTVLSSVEGWYLHRRQMATTPELYDPLTRQRILSGSLIAGVDYVSAMEARKRLQERVAELMSDVDLLLMPTSRETAPRLGQFDSHGGHPSLGRPWNVTGYPALSVRAGFDRQGLPIGLQIIGRPDEDASVLWMGHLVERLFDGADSWPDLARAVKPLEVAPQPPSDEEAEIPAPLAAVVHAAVDEVRTFVT